MRPTAMWPGLAIILAGMGIVAFACSPPVPTGTGSGLSTTSRADAEWDQIVAAARKEGRVVVSGPPGSDTRDSLTEGFERAYPGIAVEYQAGPGSAVGPKLLAERQAGQYLVDIIINGTTTQLALVEAKAIDPIQPYLVGPESRQTEKWLGGKFDFSDNAATYNLVFAHVVKAPLAYNPSLVAPGELKSYRDLLAPKWRGQIVMLDPRLAGAGFATATFFYSTESLGKEFLRQLLGHGITFSRDDRQVLDFVARGQYAIAIAPSDRMYTEFKGRGVDVGMAGAEELAEGSYLTAGVAAVGVVNQPPHPNATKVYLDYLLSREGQTTVSQGIGYVSRRLDVPSDHLPSYVIPKPGVPYQENHKEPYFVIREEVSEFIRSIIGS